MAGRAQPDAAFDPAISDASPESYLGYSKGFEDIGEAVAQGIKGAGDFLGNAVKATDFVFGENAKEGVKTAVDKTQNQYLNELADANAIPGPLKQGLSRVQMFDQARRQGKISDTYYWNNLDVEARRLRAQYPGYRDEIDSEFHKMTGSIPANALIKSLKEDVNAQQTSASAALKHELDRAYSQNTPEILTAVGRGMSPEQIGLPAMQAANARQGKVNADIENGQKRWTFEEKNIEYRNKIAFDTAGKQLDSWLNDADTKVEGTLTGQFGKVREMVDAAQGKDGRPIDDKSLAVIQQAYALAEQGYNKQFEQFMARPIELADGKTTSYGATLTREQIDGLRQKGMERFGSIRGAIADKDFGLVGLQKAWGEQAKAGTVNETMSNRVQRAAYGLSQTVGHQYIANELRLLPQVQSQVLRNIQEAAVVDAAAGRPGTISEKAAEAEKAAQEAGAKPGQGAAASFDGHVRALLSPTGNIQQKTTAAETLFKSPYEFYQNLKTPEAKDYAFRWMTSPQMTDTMLQLQKQGRQDLFGLYDRSVQTLMGDKTRQLAQDINQRSVQLNSPYRLMYDPRTYTFFAGERPEFNSPEPGVDYRQVYNQLDMLARQGNVANLNFAKLREGLGESPEQINKSLETYYKMGGGIDIKDMGYKEPGGKTQDTEEGRILKDAAGKNLLRQPLPGKGMDDRVPQTTGPVPPAKAQDKVPPFGADTKSEPKPQDQGTLTPQDKAPDNPFMGERLRIIKHKTDGKYYVIPQKADDGTPLTPVQIGAYIAHKQGPYGVGFHDLQAARLIMLQAEDAFNRNKDKLR